MNPLTPAEARILARIAAGDTNQQIARQVRRSPGSIGNAITRMYRQLGADSRAHAVAIGYNLGVLEHGASGQVGAP